MDPNSGLLYRVTNNTWSQMHYRALQITLAKNLTRGFQFIGAFHRQWQHLTGTWNPTDPARFIQPDAFPNNRLLWRTDGMQDQNSLATGNTLTNTVTAGRTVEFSANVFNVLNGGNYTEYARTGPNRIYNPASYLAYTNPQAPRALQLEAVLRF